MEEEKTNIYDDILNLIIVSALASFIFSLFNLNEFFYILIPILILFFLNYFTKFIYARKLGFNIKTKFLKIERYWFAEWGKFPFSIPVWLIFPFLFSILSYNAIKFFTFLGFDYNENLERSIRKREYSERDIAKISLTSLLLCYILTLIFHFIGMYKYAMIGIWFVLTNALPFGSMDGGKIFIFSWLIWTAVFIFLLISLLLLNLTNIWISIILALIIAMALGIIGLRKLVE